MIPIGNGAEMYGISIRELFDKVATIQSGSHIHVTLSLDCRLQKRKGYNFTLFETLVHGLNELQVGQGKHWAFMLTCQAFSSGTEN